MNFALHLTSAAGRLGIISNGARLKGLEIETPHAFLCTSRGTVPHLTYEVLQMVSKEKLGLSLSVQSVSHIQDQLKIYNNPVADYIGMPEYLTYCSYINPLEKESNNTFTTGKIGLNTANGKRHFNAESYMQFMEDLKPDMFLLLADGTPNSKSSQKKIKQSFDNSVTFFEECMEIYKKSEILKFSGVLGAIEGSSDLLVREAFSKLVGESSVFGVVISGLDHLNSNLDITSQDIKPAVEASLKHIPQNKLRIIHGRWNPNVVLDLVESGIDMFDCSYPFDITEQCGALIFPNTESILDQILCNKISNVPKENLKEEEILITNVEEPVSKKLKLSSSKYHISLLDPCYSTDFTPIDKKCSCLSCRNHTRAYIHHLVNVKEMLGKVLLIIHNLHHYLLFLSTIKTQLKCDKFEHFKNKFHTWHNEINNSSVP